MRRRSEERKGCSSQGKYLIEVHGHLRVINGALMRFVVISNSIAIHHRGFTYKLQKWHQISQGPHLHLSSMMRMLVKNSLNAAHSQHC